MKSRTNNSSEPKGWAERMVDFLLGPSHHPVYVAGAAAGFGAGHPKAERKEKKLRRSDEGDSPFVALASFGMSSYGASDSRSEGGRR
ncbi:MAG TPA: hypothetical protein VG820_02845 [Fimbriimonadaceae bacterium]|nr:hypothetical protein [Fimbriimonadaceae bacterium]